MSGIHDSHCKAAHVYSIYHMQALYISPKLLWYRAETARCCHGYFEVRGSLVRSPTTIHFHNIMIFLYIKKRLYLKLTNYKYTSKTYDLDKSRRHGLN